MIKTQGERKIDQHIEDLGKNEVFKKRLAVIKQEKSRKKVEGLLLQLCYDFSINYDLFKRIKGNEDILKNMNYPWENMGDMCEISFDFPGIFTGSIVKTPLETKLHKLAYPIRMDIHRFATKRDVLDFIDKKWRIIEKESKLFMKSEKRIRARKNKERDDFIWNNKQLSASEIVKLVSDNFQGVVMGREEVYKVINLEKERRNLNLTGGR